MVMRMTSSISLMRDAVSPFPIPTLVASSKGSTTPKRFFLSSAVGEARTPLIGVPGTYAGGGGYTGGGVPGVDIGEAKGLNFGGGVEG